jgi:hypothetical protein
LKWGSAVKNVQKCRGGFGTEQWAEIRRILRSMTERASITLNILLIET